MYIKTDVLITTKLYSIYYCNSTVWISISDDEGDFSKLVARIDRQVETGCSLRLYKIVNPDKFLNNRCIHFTATFYSKFYLQFSYECISKAYVYPFYYNGIGKRKQKRQSGSEFRNPQKTRDTKNQIQLNNVFANLS